MTPKFTHDCDCCRFLGHYAGRDVYVSTSEERPTLIARYGDEGEEHSSCPLDLFKKQIAENQPIRIVGGLILPFQDYLFSEHVIPSHKAWLMMLAVHGDLGWLR